MKREATLLFAMLGAMAFGSTMIGCEEKGPMEKTGEKIDDVADEAEDVVDEAGG